MRMKGSNDMINDMKCLPFKSRWENYQVKAVYDLANTLYSCVSFFIFTVTLKKDSLC